MLILENGPMVEPTNLVEVKQYLKLEHDFEDGLLETLISAARLQIENRFNLCLIEQRWGLFLNEFPKNGLVEIDKYPLNSVAAVKVKKGNGAFEAIEDGLVELNQGRVSQIKLDQELSAFDGIKLELIFGYGQVPSQIPDDIRHSMMSLIAYWYEDRAHLDSGFHSHIPPSILSLLSHYRKLRL